MCVFNDRINRLVSKDAAKSRHDLEELSEDMEIRQPLAVKVQVTWKFDGSDVIGRSGSHQWQ